MNSLFAKILLWFWFGLAITVVGSAFISALNVNENDSDERAPVARLVRFQLEEATSAYEIGGRPALQSFLDTLHRVYDARGVLTDENGRDLLTNEDRSDLIRRARRRVLYQVFRTGDSTVARASNDGRYWFSSSCRAPTSDRGSCSRNTSLSWQPPSGSATGWPCHPRARFANSRRPSERFGRATSPPAPRASAATNSASSPVPSTEWPTGSKPSSLPNAAC
jgi:hypothetical protein